MAFDEFVGLGEIDAAGERVRFHCTQIADGTRTIEVGAPVEFALVLGPTGRPEATAITPRRF